MKRKISIVYSIVSIILGGILYFDRPTEISTASFVYILNASLLVLIGIHNLFQGDKKVAVVNEHQILIKKSGKTLEKYDLRKAIKLSHQYNRLIIYFDGFTKQFVYKDFTKRSQRMLREAGN